MLLRTKFLLTAAMCLCTGLLSAPLMQNSALWNDMSTLLQLTPFVYTTTICFLLTCSLGLACSAMISLRRSERFADNLLKGDNAPYTGGSSDELDKIYSAAALAAARSEGRLQEAKSRIIETGEEFSEKYSQLETIVKKREHDLEIAKNHTRLLLNMTTEAVLELDLTNRVAYANAIALNMLGMEEKTVLYHDLTDIMRHGLSEKCDSFESHSVLRNALAKDEKNSIRKLWVKDRSGTSIPVSVTISPIIKDGERTGSVVSFTDLTETISSSKMVDALYEHAADGYIFFDENNTVIDCNPALAKMLKVDEKQQVIDDFFYFSPPYQSNGLPSRDYFNAVQNDAKMNTHTFFEWTHMDARGREIPCFISITQVRVNKKIMRTAYIRDAREQKKAEKALTEQREQLQRILDSCPIAMLIATDGKILQINDNGRRMLGLSEGDTMHGTYVDYSDRISMLDTVRSMGIVYRRAVKLYSSDASILDTLFTVYPFIYEGKQSLLTWIFDVTELTTAKELAEEASRAKSDFLAIMSHEIRTPMNAVLGLTHLCMQTQLDTRQSAYMIKIKNSATLLQTLINDILDLTSAENGKLTMMYRSFDISEVLGTAEDMLKPRAAEKLLSFEMSYPNDIPRHFIGDAERIKQIILHVGSNAVKFTEHGGVRIDVAYQQALSGGGHDEEANIGEFDITISDTGIGMTPDQLERVYVPFMQADESYTRRYDGCGLGLPITKHLVENMGGEIWAASELGKGTVFYINLPLELDEKAEAITAEDRSEGSAPSKDTPPDILLVEDNEINREIALELLSMFGANVDVAVNGKDAVEMVAEKHYDLVLMDIQMPVMDGLASTRAIRCELGLARESLPIVAMTAHALKEDYDKSSAAGMNDHITKPIDPDKLFGVLEKWTNRKQKAGK